MKFCENKIIPKNKITLSFTDIGKSCPSSDFSVANMYFNAIRENKILVKTSGFALTAKRYMGGRQTDSLIPPLPTLARNIS